ncbi:MAG: hypothetical protein ABI175_19840, partial [Polyangiales bacterium]
MRLVGSLVVHAVIGVVLIAVAHHPAPPASSPRVAIEVVDLQLPPAPVTTVDVTTAERSPGGGAGASARTSEPVRMIVASRARAARSAVDATATDAFEDPRG